MQRVNRKQARLLAKIGYNEPCHYFYDTVYPDRIMYADGSYHYNDRGYWADKRYKSYSAPYIAEVLEWIREEKGLFGIVDFQYNISSLGYDWLINWLKTPKWERSKNYYDTYKEAESALLNELINIIINNP